MYRNIVVDCQTKTDVLHCEDCIFKKECLICLIRQNEHKTPALNTALMFDLLV